MKIQNVGQKLREIFFNYRFVNQSNISNYYIIFFLMTKDVIYWKQLSVFFYVEMIRNVKRESQ